MPRRKEPAIPNELLDQLLAGGAASAAFDRGGLLDTLKKALTERALNAEMDHHLAGEDGAGNTRNGYGRKTVMTDTGKLAIDVPRDRQSSFDPQLIAKYRRRFPGFDDDRRPWNGRALPIPRQCSICGCGPEERPLAYHGEDYRRPDSVYAICRPCHYAIHIRFGRPDHWRKVMINRYVHGSGTDEPLVWYVGAAVTASARRTLLSDHQGSIALVLDADGNQVAIDSYDEYGIPGAGNVGRFQYTGQTWLPSLGLYYYKARMYSPTTGRFLQVDPVGYDDQANLYAYVGNDPQNRTDSSGLTAETASLANTCSRVGSQGCSGQYGDSGSAMSTLSVTANANGRGGNRGGQQLGQRGQAGKASGSPDPYKKYKAGTEPGTRSWRDENGKTHSGKWSGDPRTGGDGHGVKEGSRLPDGTRVPGGERPEPESAPEASESRFWLPSGTTVGKAIVVGGIGLCFVVEPCGGALASAVALVALSTAGSR